jgi:tetratricopeptide (TPR) repeat protein
MHSRIRSLYGAADSLYAAAQRAATAVPYDEEKEVALNRSALQQFGKLLERLPEGFDSLRFHLHFKLGELEHYFERHPAALKQYYQAISLKTKVPALPDSFLFKPLLYAGILHYNAGRFDSALAYYRKAEAVQLRWNNRLSEAERLYNNLGALHFETGDFRQARNYFAKAAELLPAGHPYFTDLRVSYAINQASAHTMLEEYEAALAIYQDIGRYGRHTAEMTHNIGRIYLNLGNPARALTYFSKVMYTGPKEIRLRNDQAMACMNLQRWQEAGTFLQQAEKAYRQHLGGQPHFTYGWTLQYAGNLAAATGRMEEALRLYQEALHQFYPAFTPKGKTDNPAAFSGTFSYIPLYQTLLAKASALQALRARWKGTAEAELDTYRAAYRLIDYVTASYDSDEARLFLNRFTYTARGRPVDLAFEQYRKTGNKAYLEQAYAFDQKNKATVLAYRQGQNEAAANGPARARERSLKTAITRLSLQASNRHDTAGTGRTVAAIRDLEMALGKLQDSLPPSAQARQVPAPSYLQQSLLDEKTALLSFHLSDSTLSVILIGKEAFTGRQTTLPAGFRDRLQAYIQSLQRHDGDAPERTWPEAYALFFSLLRDTRYTRLILVPDEELGYLPFEALADSTGTPLLRRYAVQYQYSTALLQAHRDTDWGRPLALAPFAGQGLNTGDEALPPLPASGREAVATGGTVLLGNAATKSAFLRRLPQFGVLHIASHARIGTSEDQPSFIAFAPEGRSEHLLYMNEIYNLPMEHTQLVVLSACETGAGALQRGEGVMSLSRAFAYAGCPNTVTSLWKADDAATAYITARLHAYLREHRPIDEALRQAKLDYLGDRSIHPRRKAPAYWAHLVFIGDYVPQKNSSAWWLLWGVPLGGIIFLIWKRRNKQLRK